jgi:hypothetical protein
MKPVDAHELPSYHLFSPPAGESDDTARKRAWKGDEFSFRDVLDIVNPLQHLPIVSSLYRWITGDSIGALPRMIGDGLYGGPIGFVTGLFNAVVKQESGKDLGEHVIALLDGEGSAPASDPKTIAAADAQPGSGAAPTPDAARGQDAAPGAAAAPAPVAAPVAPISAPATGAASPPAPRLAPLTARIGLPPSPALPAAAEAADPRAAFLARTSALHRQVAAGNGQLPGSALNSHVVPLQGIALPPGLLRANAATASSPATAPIAAANGGAANGSAPDNAAPPILPSNPPIDISQQMMEALDKYTRLVQQREAQPGAGRGNQLDLTQ